MARGRRDIKEMRGAGTQYPLCTRIQHCSFCPLCVAFVFAAYAIAPLAVGAAPLAAAPVASAPSVPSAAAVAALVVVVVWLVLAAIFSYCRLNGSTTLAAHG